MFLDTSGLMCLFDFNDERHADALELYERARVRICHNYVLAEFVALAIARKMPSRVVLEFLAAFADSNEVVLVWVDQVIHERGLELLRKRNDKKWSLCDAVSFVVMSDEGIIESLTTDHDFEQAGFVRLLNR
jgi:predicted nucleic acid-binding protein